MSYYEEIKKKFNKYYEIFNQEKKNIDSNVSKEIQKDLLQLSKLIQTKPNKSTPEITDLLDKIEKKLNDLFPSLAPIFPPTPAPTPSTSTPTHAPTPTPAPVPSQITKNIIRGLPNIPSNIVKTEQYKYILPDDIPENYKNFLDFLNSDMLKQPVFININNSKKKLSAIDPNESGIKPYQNKVVNYLKPETPYNAMIYHDVGTGKTFTAISVILTHSSEGIKTIIMLPAALVNNWKSEIEKYFNSILNINEENIITTFIRENITFISYNGGNLERKIRTAEPHNKLLIIDESHTYISYTMKKNSARGKTLEILLNKEQRPRKIVLLSATPIVNSYREIFNVIKLLIGKTPEIIGDDGTKFLENISIFESTEFKFDNDNILEFNPVLNKEIASLISIYYGYLFSFYKNPDKNSEDYPKCLETEYVECTMSVKQKKIYTSIIDEEFPAFLSSKKDSENFNDSDTNCNFLMKSRNSSVFSYPYNLLLNSKLNVNDVIKHNMFVLISLYEKELKKSQKLSEYSDINEIIQNHTKVNFNVLNSSFNLLSEISQFLPHKNFKINIKEIEQYFKKQKEKQLQLEQRRKKREEKEKKMLEQIISNNIINSEEYGNLIQSRSRSVSGSESESGSGSESESEIDIYEGYEDKTDDIKYIYEKKLQILINLLEHTSKLDIQTIGYKKSIDEALQLILIAEEDQIKEMNHAVYITKNYSAKYYSLMNFINVNRENKMKHLIYIPFVLNSGLYLLKRLLSLLGLKEYKRNTDKETKGVDVDVEHEIDEKELFDNLSEDDITNENFERTNMNLKDINFVSISGETENSVRTSILKIYNNKENMNGKDISIIMGTDVLTEGLTANCTRALHILMPTWNNSKQYQIEGRINRYKSHNFLDLEKRNYVVKKYVLKDDYLNVDKIIGNIAIKKYKMANEFINNIMLINPIDKENVISIQNNISVFDVPSFMSNDVFDINSFVGKNLVKSKSIKGRTFFYNKIQYFFKINDENNIELNRINFNDTTTDCILLYNYIDLINHISINKPCACLLFGTNNKFKFVNNSQFTIIENE